MSRFYLLLFFSVNCWPSVSGNETYVNIEYETPAQIDLQNVVIFVPLPALREAPRIQQIDGEWRYDSRNSVLDWSIVLVDNSNRRLAYVETCFCSEASDLKYLFLILMWKWKLYNGSLEFVVPAADPDVFFPISVRFTASRTFSDLKVANILPLKSGSPPKFSQ